MKKVREMAKAKKSLKGKQLVAEFGSLAGECPTELVIYTRILELMQRLPTLSLETLALDPQLLGMLVVWFRELGTRFENNDQAFFANLSKIASFLSQDQVYDLKAWRVLEAASECEKANRLISSPNIAKILDENCPLPKDKNGVNKKWEPAEVRRVMRGIGLKGGGRSAE